MTKLTTPRKSKDATGLMQEIVDSLIREPKRSAVQLAAELGYSRTAISSRISKLDKAGMLTFVEVMGSVASSRLRLYSILDGSELPATEPREKQDFGRAAVPRQATTRKYPPINRRDPLVAAMFGPAGSQQ